MRSISPALYTKRYYLTDCSGFAEFRRSQGKTLPSRLRNLTRFVKITKGVKVLDIGCGRGELAFWAASQGAKVLGIDYSSAAIKIAEAALRKHPKPIRSNVSFKVANAKELKLPPESFDVIFLMDVLEHLYREEQETVLSQIVGFLKKGGNIIAHTEPNRILVDVTYPYWCYPVSKLILKVWKVLKRKQLPHLPPPQSLRTASHKLMHVSEPTYFGLRSLFLRHELSPKIMTTVTRRRQVVGWKDWLYNLFVFADPLSRYLPLNSLFADDFIVTGVK